MKSSDIIEIRVFDMNYNTFYKRKLMAGDKKQIKNMLSELKNMGIDLVEINSIRVEKELNWW